MPWGDGVVAMRQAPCVSAANIAGFRLRDRRSAVPRTFALQGAADDSERGKSDNREIR
jgi:hypothetical protein